MKKFTNTHISAIRPSSDRQQVADPATTGLFLIVQPSGVKSWAWRGRIGGKSRKLTLGRYPAHSLADAREWATALTRQRDGGIDPLAERERKAKASSMPVIQRLCHDDVLLDGDRGYRTRHERSLWCLPLDRQLGR